MDVGGKLLAGYVAKGDVSGFIDAKLSELYFEGDELALYEFVRDHVSEYHVLPQMETVEAKFQALPKAIEPAAYYLKKVEERYLHRTMFAQMSEVHELLSTQNVHAAKDLIGKLIEQIQFQSVRQQVLDFGKEGLQLIAHEYAKAQGLMVGEAIRFGWPYLDKATGGMVEGDVVSYVGRPAAGKTYKMLYQAHNAWFEQKKSVMFWSGEMGVAALAVRLAMMHTHMPITPFKEGLMLKSVFADHEKLLYKQLGDLAEFEPKMYIVDGNQSSTPDEMFALAHHLKVKAVFADGAYLMKHKDPKMNRYMRVAENVERIKYNTSILKVPTACSWQFNRVASDKANKKVAEDAGLEDIGYADAIGQISSIVLGLFQDDSVETKKERRIKLLKGREGGVGEFKVRWDFDHMDFSEIIKQTLGDKIKAAEAANKAPDEAEMAYF